MKTGLFAIVGPCAFVLAACGGGGGGGVAGSDAGSGAGSDARSATDGRMIDAKPVDAAPVFHDGPPGTYQLTVHNYLTWCSVSVNGAATSAADTQQVFVDPATISLVAEANPADGSTFKIAANMWHFTDGDTGTGDTGMVSGGTSTAMVTVGTAAKCVWVCCPFANGTGCDVANQCM